MQIYNFSPTFLCEPKFFPKNSMDATYPDGIGNPSYLKLPNTGDLKTIIIISDGENWTYFF